METLFANTAECDEQTADDLTDLCAKIIDKIVNTRCGNMVKQMAQLMDLKRVIAVRDGYRARAAAAATKVKAAKAGVAKAPEANVVVPKAKPTESASAKAAKPLKAAKAVTPPRAAKAVKAAKAPTAKEAKTAETKKNLLYLLS